MTEEEMAEESLISYRKEPKWAGKIFMQDENTCYKAGFKDGYNKANEYAKAVIQDLLDNSDEYARQRAINYLKENEI